MNALLHSPRGQAGPRPRDDVAGRGAEALMTAASLVASVPGALNASICLHLRGEAARFTLFLRHVTRRPPRGLLAELL
jgi:hypothetical protein